MLTQESDSPQYVLDGESLKKSYSGEVVFEKVDIAVSPKQFVLLEGANGVGKSTLLGILSGVVASDAGLVRRDSGVRFVPSELDGVRKWNGEDLRRLYSGCGNDVADKTEIYRERLGLCEDDLQLPLSVLSTGTRKKVALWAALTAAGVSCVLLDEPFSGLDVHSESRLATLLSEAKESQGLAIVISAHHSGWLRAYADRVFKLSEKKLTEVNIKNGKQTPYLIVTPNAKALHSACTSEGREPTESGERFIRINCTAKELADVIYLAERVHAHVVGVYPVPEERGAE